ncbi:MAG: hypothetical protein JJ895_08765 [Balneolaceae bacterium]|nr:hypothetical protein [Balneolaceae bacterium]
MNRLNIYILIQLVFLLSSCDSQNTKIPDFEIQVLFALDYPQLIDSTTFDSNWSDPLSISKNLIIKNESDTTQKRSLRIDYGPTDIPRTFYFFTFSTIPDLNDPNLKINSQPKKANHINSIFNLILSPGEGYYIFMIEGVGDVPYAPMIIYEIKDDGSKENVYTLTSENAITTELPSLEVTANHLDLDIPKNMNVFTKFETLIISETEQHIPLLILEVNKDHFFALSINSKISRITPYLQAIDDKFRIRLYTIDTKNIFN